MARLIPEDPSIIENYAERRVAISLRDGLSDEWTAIWHVQGGEARKHWEIDFALFHPEKGLAVVEVKAGEIRLRNGKWRQQGRRIRDPIGQARDAGYSLKKQLPHADALTNPAIAIAFPSVKWKGARPTFEEEDGLFDYRHTRHEDPKSMQRLRRKWEALTANKTVTLDSVQVAEIMEKLNPRFEGRVELAAAIEESRHVLESWTGQMIRWTSDQLRALREFHGSDRVFVSGPAGSGKTLLAISEAQRVAARGGRVLFVCPSGVLLGRVVDRFADQPLVDVISMPREGLTTGLLSGIAQDLPVARREGPGLDHSDMEVEATPSPDLDSAEVEPDTPEVGYDLVVVDEYQEYSWAQVRRALDPAAHRGLADHLGVILVGDIVQATKRRERSVYRIDERDTEDFPPPGFQVITLGRNCRNSAPISQFVKLAAPTDFELSESDVDSPAPRLYVGPLGGTTGAMRVVTVIEQLVVNEDVPPHDIVILRHWRDRTFEKVLETLKTKGWHIPVYEVEEFLGSESNVVVFYDDLGIHDEDQLSERFSVLRYLAMTRACALLVVIADEDLHGTAIPPRYRDVLSLILAARQGRPMESVLLDDQIPVDERRMSIEAARALGIDVIDMPMGSSRSARRRLYARRRQRPHNT